MEFSDATSWTKACNHNVYWTQGINLELTSLIDANLESVLIIFITMNQKGGGYLHGKDSNIQVSLEFEIIIMKVKIIDCAPENPLRMYLNPGFNRADWISGPHVIGPLVHMEQLL